MPGPLKVFGNAAKRSSFSTKKQHLSELKPAADKVHSHKFPQRSSLRSAFGPKTRLIVWGNSKDFQSNGSGIQGVNINNNTTMQQKHTDFANIDS